MYICLHIPIVFFSSGFSRNLFQKQTNKLKLVEMAQQQQIVGTGNGGAGTGKRGRKEAADWQDVDTLLPVGPVNVEEIKQRYAVRRTGSRMENFIYFLCRHQPTGCKSSMRWAKQGGLLQQHGQHNHAVKAPAKKQAAVDWQQKAVNGTVGVRQICANFGVHRLLNESHEEVHFSCKEPRCPLRVKWLLADGTVWALGKHEQH